MQLSPLPPGAPPALLDIQNAARELSEPTYPHRVFACLETALPAADKFKYCQVWVTDVPVMVVSDGVDWIRTDTGVAL